MPCRAFCSHTSAVRSFLFSENIFHRVHSTLNTQLPLNALTSAQFTQTWRTERYIANCKRKWERGRGVDTAIGCRKRNRNSSSNSSSSNYYQTFCTICNDFFPPSRPKRDKLSRESTPAQENCTSCCSFSVFWLFFCLLAWFCALKVNEITVETRHVVRGSCSRVGIYNYKKCWCVFLCMKCLGAFYTYLFIRNLKKI